MDFYKALWSRIGGRPWTYILRDFWYRVEGLCIIALVAGGAVMGHFMWHDVLKFILAFALGYVGGHLFWGKDYIPGQRGDSGASS
jgi:hypothetical protein